MELLYTIISGCVTLAAALMYRYAYGEHLSPDGQMYLKYAARERVPLPYSMRWLLPMLLKHSYNAWHVVMYFSQFTLGAVLYTFLKQSGTGELQAITGVGLAAGLSGLVRTNAVFPILTDLFSIVLVLLGCCVSGWAAWAFWGIAACANEKSPVFAGLFTWEYAPLILTVIPAVAMLFSSKEKTDIAWLDNPFRAAWNNLKKRKDYLSSWGVVSAGLITADIKVWVTVVIAYLPLMRSMDYARIVQWAAPVLILSAVQIIPLPLLGVAVLVHWVLTEKDKTV